MSDEYWLLLAFSFLLLIALLLVGLPVLSILIGLIIGLAALALGFGTPEYNPWGDFFINSAKFFWNYWWLMIIAALAVSIAFLRLSRYLKKRK